MCFVLACLGCCIVWCGSAQAARGITVAAFGRTDAGEPVERVTLENARGMKVSVIDYGATLTAIEVPDRAGKQQNVLLSLPDLPAYIKTERRFAAVIGRYAGRIAGARYTLAGQTVQLIPNAKGMTTHGGPQGFDKRVWQRRDFTDTASLGSIFTLVSPDGDQQFPGQLTVTVTYRLLRRVNELRIEYAATTSAPTVLNLTNHGFFNLAGAGSAGLATHTFQLFADRYAEVDAKKIPTGRLLPVAGTALDFRRPQPIGARLDAPSVLMGEPAGYDHTLVFNGWHGALLRAAVIDESRSGRRLAIYTTEPSVQFNSANGFEGLETGSEGIAYQRGAGFAFETQHLPDSPNQPAFPSTALLPGQVFHSQTRFRFSLTPGAQ